MEEILLLRKQLNDRTRRARIITNEACSLLNTNIVFTYKFADNQQNYWEDEENYSFKETILEEIGKNVWIFSEVVAGAVFSEKYIGSNLRHYIKNIASEFNTDIYKFEFLDESGIIPSTDGWLPYELSQVRIHYEMEILRKEMIIARIRETLRKINEITDPMPNWVKSSVLGLFGQGDQALPFTYSEDDFVVKSYNNREKMPQVMNARWFAPIFGLENATKIEKSFELITKACEIDPKTND